MAAPYWAECSGDRDVAFMEFKMLRGDDGDSNKNVKKAIRFKLEQQTCKYITLFGTFSCRSFHYHVKFQHTTMDFPFSF